MQGLTEFLPISTSAHLVLPSMLFGWPPQGLVLDVAMHAGSLAAVLVYFRQDLAHFSAGLWKWFREGQADVYVRLMAQVLTATLPIVALGILLRDWVRAESALAVPDCRDDRRIRRCCCGWPIRAFRAPAPPSSRCRGATRC